MPFNPQVTCDVTIDVSHWQGNNIDWGKVQSAGKHFVMIKATQGTGKDSCWEINRQRAQQAGLLIMPYHFVTGDDATAQAQFFIDTAGLTAGMAAALDWEGESAPSADVVEQIGLAVAAVIGRDPLGYWGLNPPDEPTDTMAQWPRWIPRYGVDNGQPDWNHKPTERWLFWQYTSKATVDGIAGRVDASLFAGSEDELKAWWQTGTLPGALV